MSTFDPKKLIATFGVIPLSDYSEGTFLECTPDQDDFTTELGVDGEVEYIKNVDSTYTITVSLAQTSIVNDLLSAARLLDLKTNVGALPFLIKDLQGVSLAFFKRARIIKSPSLSYAGSTEPRVWTFKCSHGEIFVGGNIIN